MKKTTIFLIVLCLSLAPIFAAQAQLDNSLLWKVSGNGLAQPSYLYGTIHLMCPQDIKITEDMQAAIANTEQMVLELDMDEPGMMQKMMGASMMQSGTTLQDLLSEEEYQMLDKFMQDSVGVPLQAMASMKPMLLSTVTILPVLKCQPGSYEMNLVKAAQAEDMEVLGLETVEDQIAAFDAIPLEEQVAYLVESIREYDATVQEVQDMISDYQAQDISSLYQMINESMAEMEGGEDALLTDRNLRWIPQMEQMAKDKPTFFAVGAGHLGGPQGVIKLLQEAGYQVDTVPERL